MNNASKEYLSQYINIDETIERHIDKHTKRYGYDKICAWYSDMQDFYYDWCYCIGYTKTEARKLLHGGKGEFTTLPNNNGIVRFVIE